MKILVTRMDHLGDVVLTTPLVRTLAQAGHEVVVVVPQAWLPVFAHSPRVSCTLAMEDICPEFPKSWRPLADWIRRQEFSAILLPFAGHKQLLWASAFSGVKTRIAMWAGVWGRLTWHRCLSSGLLENPRYFGDVLLDLARELGISATETHPEIFLAEEEVSAGRELLRSRFGDQPVIGVHPGSAGNACNLPGRDYGEIARQLLERTSASLVITGSVKERELLAQWPVEVLTSPRVWNSVGGLSLRQLMTVQRHLAVFLCSSTGPLHLAAALNTPTVSPFCALNNLSPKVWGNQRTNAIAFTPEESFCRQQRKREAGNCDFCGQMPLERLVEAVMRQIPAP